MGQKRSANRSRVEVIMIGNYLSTFGVCVFAYLYPLFLCFKALEMHKKSPEKLRGWCIYWLVLATFTVFERLTDAFLFFLPLYHEAKVAFVVYLWHPKSQGALYIYDKFVGPTLSKHEGSIDRKIEETQAKVGDVIFSYSKMAYAYVQKMTLQLLQSLPTAQAAMHAQQQGGAQTASEPVNPIKKEPVATEAK